MEAQDFEKRGQELLSYIADYIVNIRSRRVTPAVEPGFLEKLLPDTAPVKGENWEIIMADFEKVIMPGMSHWQHPNYHAYYPIGHSYTSVLSDMLSDGLGSNAFSWVASPACVELEVLVLDWVGKMIGLPKQFLHASGQGGGVIQGSASECVLVALLSARHKSIQALKSSHPQQDNWQLLAKLVAYTSIQAHSCVEKAGMIGFVKMRHLDVDEKFSLRGHVLEDAIEEDKKLGLIPFFVCATLGTTACCSFDNLQELGDVCTRHGVYLHVDAAYAGAALICPEFQFLKDGIENVDSFGFNACKLFPVNTDCALMWVQRVETLTSALAVDPLYLRANPNLQYGYMAPEFRHWGIPLVRRFRALKLWFVVRMLGVQGLQHRIRENFRLAQLFMHKMADDRRFQVMADVTMGLVCFRLQGPNHLTQRLLKDLNASGQLYLVPALLNDNYVIRFVVCSQHTCDDDINHSWEVIHLTANTLLQQEKQLSLTEGKTQKINKE
ncbi:aromatic-L-amino-acid decarboxylase-like [Physella acuta]|uniref:aromatic-L-amino-acid decarboxylase-like n=1 Tax=Physella acuta TaxID=109671 RepID=UPI0027DC894E|nr:aromatic-L-amino-acid decarboxylase-like [Physella acuta]